MYIDQSQMGQILLNLVRNSEEALGDTGEIVISAREEKGRAVIQIADTGPGIPSDQLEDVFKDFFSTKQQGLGLGLSVCNQLARAHGGTITIENREGNGAVVTLCLPFHEMV